MSKPIPGVTYPTLKPFTSGTGNSRDSAIAAQTSNDTTQNKLNQVAGIRKRGGTGKVAAPQMTLSYTSTGGPGQDPNSIMASNTQTSSQIQANSQYDSYASKGGNKYRWGCKSGGNKYRWGCKSGGKKTKKNKKNKKTKKTKKTKTKSF